MDVNMTVRSTLNSTLTHSLTHSQSIRHCFISTWYSGIECSMGRWIGMVDSGVVVV